jgi:hypothetical protein
LVPLTVTPQRRNATTVTTTTGPMPAYMEREFRRYLDCGVGISYT